MPNAHGRRSFSFQIWFLETNKAGQCNKFKRRPISVPRFIGRPVRATPNHKMEAASSVQQKDKMADGTPSWEFRRRRLCVSHSLSMGPISAKRGQARGGGGTLGISGWGSAAGTLVTLTYTRASSAKFCYPIIE